MAEKVITLPWPERVLSQNSRAHWSKRAKATKRARSQAWAAAMESPRIKCMPQAVIFVEYYPINYRMDVQNCHAMMKAYIDGIADAMGCDDRLFKVDFPSVYAGKSSPGKVVFRILPQVVAVPMMGVVS